MLSRSVSVLYCSADSNSSSILTSKGERAEILTKEKRAEDRPTLQKGGCKIDMGKNFQREKKPLKLARIARVTLDSFSATFKNGRGYQL